MFRRLLMIGLLALPGAFVVLALVSLHPRGRAVLIRATGSGDLIARVTARLHERHTQHRLRNTTKRKPSPLYVEARPVMVRDVAAVASPARYPSRNA